MREEKALSLVNLKMSGCVCVLPQRLELMICKHEEFTRKNTTSDGAILYQELPNT